MSRWVLDTETNGLLLQADRLWVLSIYNMDTGEHLTFLEGDMRWIDILKDAKLLVGHNLLGYDIPVLEKICGWKPSKDTTLHDTLILSQTLDYNRLNCKHSLEAWGEYFNYKKIEFHEFEQFSPEMVPYCEQDVRLTFKIYEKLLKEAGELISKNFLFKIYLQAEHAVAKWCAKATLHGWPFDVEEGLKLITQLEAEMQKAKDALESKLGWKCVAVDKCKGVYETKYPQWTKQGLYNQSTARWFGVTPESGIDDPSMSHLKGHRMINGEYSRVEFQPLKLSSSADVKMFLYRHGWVPTEWNFVKDPVTGNKRKSTPKITEESLELLGGEGALYPLYQTAKSRYGILKTWLENVDENHLLHGTCIPIGTPSMRATHNIIVNIPSADSLWGKELRSLFKCKPGWKLIGCDSSGNQARGLAHYLGDKDFIETLLNGDIHQYNADVLTRVLSDMGIDFTVPRPAAKRILYAFLFGASGAKLWSYLFGIPNPIKGNKLKDGFLKAVPGFKKLIDRLEEVFNKTSAVGDGYIPSLVGNKLYVNSKHKLLVFLLQATEKITCSAAIMLTMQRLEEENIPYIPCIFYHDEEDFMVPEEYSEKAAAIGKQSFIDGPKLFGIEIMNGDSKIGDNWYEIH
jgi:hypothetical protein